jgi:hypothetical protein
MAALVLVTVSPGKGMSGKEGRIGIFPGGATPTMHPAETPFWVGYGFAADPQNGAGLDEDTTRFELDVDGKPVSMLTDVHSDSGIPVRKTNIAEFPEGLQAGWHDFSGRWYDGGRLILSSRAAIEFVER